MEGTKSAPETQRGVGPDRLIDRIQIWKLKGDRLRMLSSSCHAYRTRYVHMLLKLPLLHYRTTSRRCRCILNHKVIATQLLNEDTQSSLNGTG